MALGLITYQSLTHTDNLNPIYHALPTVDTDLSTDSPGRNQSRSGRKPPCIGCISHWLVLSQPTGSNRLSSPARFQLKLRVSPRHHCCCSPFVLCCVVWLYRERELVIMQSSLLLRARGLPKCASLSVSLARQSSRAMGSYATFKVPRIDNEPNVSIGGNWSVLLWLIFHQIETLCPWIPRS